MHSDVFLNCLSVCQTAHMSIYDASACAFLCSFFFEPNVNTCDWTHEYECEWMRSEVIGLVHRITSGTAEDRRRGERRKREDALLQLINQRLLAWK